VEIKKTGVDDEELGSEGGSEGNDEPVSLWPVWREWAAELGSVITYRSLALNRLVLSFVGDVPKSALRLPGFSPTKFCLKWFNIQQG
jgi:hypothetical protein